MLDYQTKLGWQLAQEEALKYPTFIVWQLVCGNLINNNLWTTKV